MSISSEIFKKVFKCHFDFTFRDLSNILSGDCHELSISQYEELIAILKSLKDKPLNGLAKVNYTYINSSFPEYLEAKSCYFCPNLSWSKKECLEWFSMIGFDMSKLANRERVQEEINGRILLHGTDGEILLKEEWDTLRRVYEIYIDQFCLVSNYDEKKRYLNAISSFFVFPQWKKGNLLLGELNALAMNFKYENANYSCQDFTSVIKEIISHTPHPPPDYPIVDNEVIEYFAPYTSLIQSSCSGKSRFLLTPIKEDFDTRVMVVYCTLKSNLGYFVGSEFIDELRARLRGCYLEDSSRFLGSVFCAFYEILLDERGYLKPEFEKLGSVYADDLWKLVKGTLKAPCVLSQIPKCWREGKEKNFYLAIAIDEAHNLLESVPNRADFGIPEAVFPKPSSGSKRARADPEVSAKIVSVDGETKVDEAITEFTILRRALLVQDAEGITIPVVLASTNSKITNFMPNIAHDSSRRENLVNLNTGVIRHLHRPIILQETFDILARDIQVSAPPKEYLLSFDYLKNIFLFGRPYWGALLKKGAVDDDVDTMKCMEKIFVGASHKLLARANGKALHAAVDSLDSLALLGHTIGIKALTKSKSEFASKVVESKMGFLQYVDNINGFITSTFHPDPVLAVAAAKTIFSFKDGGSKLLAVLEEYSRLSELGNVEIGAAGEFVFRLSLMIAKNLAPPVRNLAYEVPKGLEYFRFALPRFWGEVLGCLAPISRKNEAENEEFLTGMVNFTHFFKIESLNEADSTFQFLLEQALTRGGAIIMPDGNLGVDLVVPIVSASGRVTCALVQVKNYAVTEQVPISMCLAKMQQFAMIQGLDDPFYLLAILSHRDYQKAVLKGFELSTRSSLAKTYKCSSKISGLILQGLSFKFEYKGNKNLKGVLRNLADAFRSAKNRLTPKFAHFYQNTKKTFVTQGAE